MRRRRTLTLIIAPVVALLTIVGYTASTAQAQAWESCDQWGENTFDDGYTVYNNIWGSGAGSQCISAESGQQFTVHADHPDTGGIKSYPNSNWNVNQPINAINSFTTSYDVTVPEAGAYNTAYDIWDENHQHEIMLWLNWYGPVGPIGSPVGTAELGGHTWDVYTGSNGANNVYSFLRQGNSSAGEIDVVPILDYIVEQGWMSADTVIGQSQLGFEITSSAGGMDFTVNNYAVSTS
ncbi:GH12 family glycosyl hydrolase domain-containing protein [Streptomyces sp. 6N223]|uniref:GH12 family glycosyl hydrolase domain-containing protein n=1 Tax=Streptomyces sp. 6N223 TaxID=3457412 RepID=UPI003FCFBD33